MRSTVVFAAVAAACLAAVSAECRKCSANRSSNCATLRITFVFAALGNIKFYCASKYYHA